MKNIKKIFACVMVMCVLLVSMSIPAFAAKDINTYQKSVVGIGANVEFSSSNLGVSLTKSGSGTGFALGKPGSAVQYLGTCAHVVQEPAGIYALIIDSQTEEYIDLVPMEEGTSYPQVYSDIYNGTEVVIGIDYFTTKTVDLYAIFSEASQDYTSLTTVSIDKDRDLAICKLASEPTTKITPLPIKLKENVKVSDEVIAVGYASTSDRFNTEARYDATDSTLKDGIVSKIQRTSGNTDSEITYDMYDVTAELTTGMSGGPVISKESGAVIGVTAFGTTDPMQATGDRYAVCIDYLVNMMDTEKIPYEICGANDNGIVPILIIAGVAGVVILGGVIILIVILSKRKKKVYTPVKPVNNVNYPQASPAQASPAPAAADKKYYLVGISGVMAGKKFGVVDRAIIGRDSVKCNVVYDVNQPGISGVHCEVKISGGVMTLKDCGSSYGTYLVNGTKLESGTAVVLQNGDRFWIGVNENMFEVRY